MGILKLKKKEPHNADMRRLISLLFNKLIDQYEIRSSKVNTNAINVIENKEEYDNFKKLAIFCFKNFDIPESHNPYIEKHLKNQSLVSEKFGNSEAVSFLENDGLVDKDNCMYLKMPLTALEVLFDYGAKDVDYYNCATVSAMIFELLILKPLKGQGEV